jgi:NNP family nitrate/nitrite transporter-like MFS transporter
VSAHSSVSPSVSAATNARTPRLMLGLATAGFAVNFWAWALLSPLAPGLKDSLHLTSFQQALIVAVPVIVGALGRIPVGALTDRLGGRVMFPVVSFATILPVLYMGLSGHTSFAGLIVGGFFLGIGGTAFAVGVPLVSGWFAATRRGTVIGIFGAGMGGTAISALTTVKLSKAHGFAIPFVLSAIVLASYGVLAMIRMAGFVQVAVLLRPIGGWLSDRFEPIRVLVASLAVVALGAALQASTPGLAPTGTRLGTSRLVTTALDVIGGN